MCLCGLCQTGGYLSNLSEEHPQCGEDLSVMILVVCTFGVGIGCFNLGVGLSVPEDLMALEIYSILRTVEYLHAF